MAPSPELNLEKLETLLTSARARVRQVEDVLAEIDALLHEQPTSGQLAKRLINEFCQQWAHRYRGQSYVVDWPKNTAQMKRALKGLEAEDIAARMPRYLASPDPYHVNARHPLALFLATLNQWGGTPAADAFLEAPPADCPHRPRCGTDAACTKRSLRERRAS